MTLAYLIFVQPVVMNAAGMDLESALLATCIASALATFRMGLIANYPIALAPDGSLPRARRAFLADAVGTTAGALLGTSTVTSYV